MMLATQEIIVHKSKDAKVLHDARWEAADWLTTGYNWAYVLAVIVLIVGALHTYNVLKRKR